MAHLGDRLDRPRRVDPRHRREVAGDAQVVHPAVRVLEGEHFPRRRRADGPGAEHEAQAGAPQLGPEHARPDLEDLAAAPGVVAVARTLVDARGAAGADCREVELHASLLGILPLGEEEIPHLRLRYA